MSISSDTAMLGAVLPDICFPSEIDLDPIMGLTKSPSALGEFLVDEESESTYPLLTPSPPVECNRLLSGDAQPGVVAYEQQISPLSTDYMEMPSLLKLNGTAAPAYGAVTSNEFSNYHANNRDDQQVFGQNKDPSVLESSSSSSSVLQEQTVCAQLLSSHLYQHLTKSNNTDSFNLQENGGKAPLAGLQMSIHKSPEDYCFLNWNWPLIRKFSFWSYISMLFACVCIVVGLMAKLPAVCDPSHGWWQGTVFYEIFPGSFQDSNSDGIGDFYGLAVRAAYLESLGVKAVRLNYIFESKHYPETYKKVTNLTKIDHSLGVEGDFDHAIAVLHKHNILIVLDLPVHPYVNHIVDQDYKHAQPEFNKTDQGPFAVDSSEENSVSHAISYWLGKGIDGFYLKDLELITEEDSFSHHIKRWRKIVDKHSELGNEKILMCSMNVLDSIDPLDVEKLNAILNRMDLIDAKIDVNVNATDKLKEQYDEITKGILYSKPGYPWIHWHVGSAEMPRLASRLRTHNNSLALIMFQLMLPGTQSIFYGDEIGLENSENHSGEHHDISELHQLVPMQWNKSKFTSNKALPWLPGAPNAMIEKQSVIQDVIKLRTEAPSIYMNGVWKDHENLLNTEIRLVKDVVIVERRYPRRNSYVLVTNLSDQIVTQDLSVYYFGGLVMVDMQGRKGKYITFHTLTLYPGESIIVKLDK